MDISIFNNINWTMIIDWGLRIVQIVTFVGLIIKISLKNEDYIDNIEIKTISPHEFNLLHKQFHFINEFNHTPNEISTNHFLFYPKGVDILKIEFFSLVFKDKLVEKKIHEIKNLKNQTCLLIHTNLPDTIPQLMMKWETVNGEIGEYTFQFNGYNGNTNISNYKYKLTLKRKILTILGL